MLPHPLANFEIQKYYQNAPRFNGFFSRDNLSVKIKDGVYIVNLVEYSDIGTHWVVFYVQNNDVTYLILLEQSISQKILKYLLTIKTLKQIFLEYKHMIK